MNKQAVVLLSGGIDSTTCLAIAVEKWNASEILAISIVYGQRHKIEVENAEAVASHYKVNHDVIELPKAVFASEDSALTSSRDIPNARYADLPEGVSPTYVPFRNGTLLSVATAIAAGEHAQEVYFGAHADDAARWAYPDCSPEFIGAMANAIYIGSYMKTRLITPLEWLAKKDVVAVGSKLNAPYELTRSCYKGERLACGRCPTCQDRLEAFAANHIADPIEYPIGVR